MCLRWLISLVSFNLNLCFIWASWLQSWRAFLFSRFSEGISQQSSVGSICASWEFVPGNYKCGGASRPAQVYKRSFSSHEWCVRFLGSTSLLLLKKNNQLNLIRTSVMCTSTVVLCWCLCSVIIREEQTKWVQVRCYFYAAAVLLQRLWNLYLLKEGT